MNQKQLQIARAALWRQTANPALTLDDAAAWIDETGLCLFLPRHAQLPAPAPSLVEACAGEARAVFPASAIDSAMELVARLAADGRAVPLNLMGNFSEQPDFVSSPDALRWIASVRGDRNWKAAPAGRTAPLVARTWEALNSGEKTVTEIQEILGRELTEGAVLRALIELWTTLRAFPRYESGQATRWALAKDRFPRQLGAAAGTAQATGLSALISLYLRSAVAATAEEAEVFLSPLTARSRVREVLHGMLATRQLGTTALGVDMLLFVEGSLPEMAPEPETGQAAAGESRPAPQAIRSPRRERREPQEARPAPGGYRKPRREGKPERPDFGRGSKPPFRPGQRRESGPARGKPWEKRRAGEFAAAEGNDRPERGQQREGGWKAQKSWNPSGRPAGNRPLSREGRPAGARGKRFEGRPPREARERSEGRPASPTPWKKRGPREKGKFGENRSGPKQFGPKKFGKAGFGAKKSRPRPDFAGAEGSKAEDRRPRGERPPFRAGNAGPGRQFRPGAAKWQNRSDRKSGRFGKPRGKSFRKPGAPAGRKPRKPGEGEKES